MKTFLDNLNNISNRFNPPSTAADKSRTSPNVAPTSFKRMVSDLSTSPNTTRARIVTDWGIDDLDDEELLTPASSSFSSLHNPFPQPRVPPFVHRRNSSRTTSVSTRSDHMMHLVRPPLGLDTLVLHEEYPSALPLNPAFESNFFLYPLDHAAEPWGVALDNDATDLHKLTALWDRVKRLILLNQNLDGELFDKLKYSLIVSNLLDDSIVILKNDELLLQLSRESARDEGKEPLKVASIYGAIIPLKQRYRLKPWTKFGPYHVVTMNLLLARYTRSKPKGADASLIIPFNTEKPSPRVQNLVASIVLLSCVIHFKNRHVKSAVQKSAILQTLQPFLGGNFTLNKLLGKSLSIIKESEVYRSLQRGRDGDIRASILPPPNPTTLLELNALMTSVVELIIGRFHKNIKLLLPFLNGEILERYCEIYNLENIELVLLSTMATNHPIQAEEISSFSNDTSYDAALQPAKSTATNRQSLRLRTFSLHSENANDQRNGATHPSQSVKLTVLINQLNQVRKFFICELLTLNEPPQYNFFLSKFWEIFKVPASSKRFLDTGSKIALIRAVLLDSVNDLKLYNQVLQDVTDRHGTHQKTPAFSSSGGEVTLSPPHLIDTSTPSNSNRSSVSFNSIGGIHGRPTTDASHIAKLSYKVDQISSNLMFLQLYNRESEGESPSSRDLPADSGGALSEKIHILENIGLELNSAIDHYQKGLYELRMLDSEQQRQNQIRLRNKQNQISGLRSFSTNTMGHSSSVSVLSRANMKKRFSLPPQAFKDFSVLNSPVTTSNADHGSSSAARGSLQYLASPLRAGKSSFEDSSAHPDQAHPASQTLQSTKKYKRLSTGLQVSLLTVFEELSPAPTHHPRMISYDDNYLNITPSDGIFSGNDSPVLRTFPHSHTVMPSDANPGREPVPETLQQFSNAETSVIIHDVNNVNGEEGNNSLTPNELRLQLTRNFESLLNTQEIKKASRQAKHRSVAFLDGPGSKPAVTLDEVSEEQDEGEECVNSLEKIRVRKMTQHTLEATSDAEETKVGEDGAHAEIVDVCNKSLMILELANVLAAVQTQSE
ncbi:hypothetical protein BABINDRAFT_160828 [Babjeviella inositovora NRRL Y-12698]|uniref:Myosin-binding domain-containing protein n=1 Tax=Babjeviella inositovora NRRL Y-12698 TaxID=984486 RepID=A0A1E3QS85_9ASCO|nr:uncharacterized protein BABINDRAFT_160828 [Babjeviella inositovora NRRL Y-12698]ODQ80565.1 hypothetical protein BABINDRAFT_160828 [Babjeviella inositovora NRRL Y-12698]